MSIGVVGFGRLGRLLARHFSRDCRVLVCDRRPVLDAGSEGAAAGTLAEVCAQEVVVPCVPISEFEAVIRRIAPLLKPGTLVVDVCSVKEHPVEVMKARLPRSVEILATHPNFGPDSAADSLEGRQIALWPVRLSKERYGKVRRLLARKGLELVELRPAEHDRLVASSLLLTHFVGRGLVAFGAEPTGFDTEGYRRLLRVLQTVRNDTWQLFADMNRYNRFAAPMRRRWLAALRGVDRRVRR